MGTHFLRNFQDALPDRVPASSQKSGLRAGSLPPIVEGRAPAYYCRCILARIYEARVAAQTLLKLCGALPQKWHGLLNPAISGTDTSTPGFHKHRIHASIC